VELYRKKSMKVFVTGATGFVGNNLARKLLEKGYEVNVLARKSSNLMSLEGIDVKVFEGDLLEPGSLSSALKGCKACFHAAANYSFWARDPNDFYRTNVEGTMNMMFAANKAGIEKIIYTSSESTVKLDTNEQNGFKSGQYRHKSVQATSDKAIQSNRNENEENDYAELNQLEDVAGGYKKSKILAEIEIKELIKAGWPIVVVAPTTPIGAWDIKPTPTGRITLDFLLGKMPAYVNTGMNVIDVEDVAAGHILALEKGKPGKKYILGNKNLTLKQIFEILSNLTGKKAPDIQIPLWIARTFGNIDEFFSGKIMKKKPSIPVDAVRSAYKFRFFDCEQTIGELGLPQSSVEDAFGKAVNWFVKYGYVNGFAKNQL
jgi:dihydroflavonol-4-reductase